MTISKQTVKKQAVEDEIAILGAKKRALLNEFASGATTEDEYAMHIRQMARFDSQFKRIMSVVREVNRYRSRLNIELRELKGKYHDLP